MSPVQARGEPVGPASDLFSLGILLQELFEERRAYDEVAPPNCGRPPGERRPPGPGWSLSGGGDSRWLGSCTKSPRRRPRRRKEEVMAEAERIDVERAAERVRTGDALLACAYDDEEKCRRLALRGSISLAELRDRDVSRDREIIFYCA
jgi:hypothetical protein